jgi:hypothetical protein
MWVVLWLGLDTATSGGAMGAAADVLLIDTMLPLGSPADSGSKSQNLAQQKINTESVFSRVRAGNAHEAPFFRLLNNQPPSTLRHLPVAPRRS